MRAKTDSKHIIYGARCKHGRLHGLLAAGIASPREDAKSIAAWIRDGSTVEQLPSAAAGAEEWKTLGTGCPQCRAELPPKKARRR